MSARRRRPDAETDFLRTQDISYLDPELPPATLRLAVNHYVVSALIYGGVLLVFTISPWFRDILQTEISPWSGKRSETEPDGFKAVYLYYCAFGLYLVIAPFVFFIGRPRSLWASKNLLIAGYLARLARFCWQDRALRKRNVWRPNYRETHALMFLLIKIVYGPLMIYSALRSYNSIPEILRRFQFKHSLLDTCDEAYLLLIPIVFLVDSLLFAVGYHTESGLLRNKLRYAETNPLHILVCIACYPPFNMTTGVLFGPSNHDPSLLFRGDIMHPVTWVLRGFAVFFLVILASTSVALFTKASNLTNRGIVQWGPYSIIRHPGYVSKNLFWLITLIPALIPHTADPQFTWHGYIMLCTVTIWGLIGWGTLYVLRSLTEEKFLMRDPDYVAYCQKVKWRFIPGVC